ncbi:uncharacterized protein MELLADRAFT_104677 [Melampsora larici-populina 98AG31]|uniref:Uncharacterized protein n=1 Tax=Melampsora larici-populina (strain 98AG31 / pathotype 3-4-7) TaxID=747676 RepID=F4RFJ2_MELLP|nr:uncharacterized protein MELLADRAFT_104677 [Melampsora larici-populina 98AG31]EGG08920.1 hypothetical protein MELLADRAFT_104677 [Melampsora larici-populina 98AG31]
MISQHGILASWTISFFIFRFCKSGLLIHATDEPLWRHNTVGHIEALWSNFHDDALLNLASDSNHDHQSVDRKSSNKRVLWELDPTDSQRSPTIDGNVKKKSGIGRSVSEADMLSRGISSGRKEVNGLRPVTTGRKVFRTSLLDIPGTNFVQTKSLQKDPMRPTISPTSVLDVSSDAESEKASLPTISAAGQHIDHIIPSSKSLESIKESASASSSPGINTLSNEAVAPKLDAYSIDPVEKSDEIIGSASERHGRLRLYLPRPNLVKAPPPPRTRRLTKGSGILDGFYDKLYEERAVISSLTKRILDIVVLDLVNLDSKSVPILLELKTLLITVGEKLNHLRQHTFVRLYATFSVWQESRKKAVEILEKVSIIYLESINQLKDASGVVHAQYNMSQKFLRMMKQELLEVGLASFKSHVKELMRQVEDIAPREYGKKLDPLAISLDAHEHAPFRLSILGLKEPSKPVEIKHRQIAHTLNPDVLCLPVLDVILSGSESGARVAGVLIIDDMPAHIRMLQRVVNTPRSSTLNDFEALEESLLDFKKCLRTSFTLMAWGFAHNLPPSSLDNLLDDSMALNRILKTLRHILDLHPLHPRGIGKPGPDYEDIGDFIAETLVKSIGKGSKILLERLTFMSQEGSREPTGLHWFWGADAALDHFPHHLLPERSYQRSCYLWKFCLNQVDHMLQTAIQDFELLEKRALEEINVVHWSAMESLSDRILMFRRELDKLLASDVGPISTGSIINPVPQYSRIEPKVK